MFLLSTVNIWSIISNGGYVFALVVVAIGVVYVYRSTNAKENNELKNDLIDTQRKTIEELKTSVADLVKRDDEQQGMIDDLKKDLDTWKNLPIRQLSDDYHKLAVAVEDMSKILKILVKEDSDNEAIRKRNPRRSS